MPLLGWVNSWPVRTMQPTSLSASRLLIAAVRSAKSWALAKHPKDAVGQVQGIAQLLLDNKPLWRRAKALDFPTLALHHSFEARKRLGDMTKQLMAPKAQADLMESMMGALCQVRGRQRRRLSVQHRRVHGHNTPSPTQRVRTPR